MFTSDTNELAQHKLILMYIIDKIHYPVTNTDITEFVLENNLMNYFVVQQYLSELVSSSFLSINSNDDTEYYELSQKGKDTLNYLNYKIPDEIKARVSKKYQKKKQEKKKETQIVGDYFKKNENEYMVNLKVIENETVLFNLSLNVVSEKQAKLICKKWRNNSNIVYKSVFNLLT